MLRKGAADGIVIASLDRLTVAVHERGGHTDKGRVTRLYDRLAAVLRRPSPERRAAFAEYLDAKASPAARDDGRMPPQHDSSERQDRQRPRG
jgi:hypothetical protein